MTASIVCLHASQSGRLFLNAAGVIDGAEFVCDTCGDALAALPEQAADARAQSMLPSLRGAAAA